MTTATDILLRDAPNRNRFWIAVSRAFGIDPDLVTVTDAEGTDPIPDDVQILLIRQPDNMPGDFPEWYHLSVEAGLVERIDSAFDAVAGEIGMVILTEGEGYFEVELHLPDGTRHTVEIVEDENDALWVTPEIQRLIDHATRQPPAPTVATTA